MRRDHIGDFGGTGAEFAATYAQIDVFNWRASHSFACKPGWSRTRVKFGQQAFNSTLPVTYNMFQNRSSSELSTHGIFMLKCCRTHSAHISVFNMHNIGSKQSLLLSSEHPF